MVRHWSLLLGLLAMSACAPRIVRETVFETPQVRVELRHTKGGAPSVNHAHPVAIADVRVAHILASLTHRDSKGKVRPTIRSEHIFPLAEGIAKAMSRATPQDEIAAVAFGKDKRLLVFSSKRATAFHAYFEADEFVIDFYSIEDLLENDPEREEYRIPTRPQSWAKGFTLLAGDGIRLVGPQQARITWRDPIWARPVSLRTRGGRVQRRTVLMEMEESAPELTLPPQPSELDDAQRSALDEIEAARRAGIITETEFRRRRVLILEGHLQEAGFGDSASE